MAEGDGPPIDVLPPPSPRKYWTRRGVAEWPVERLGEPTPTLVGIDHGSNDPALAFDLLPAAKLQSRCSYSNGGSYRLGWRTVNDHYSGIVTEPVRRIAARFERDPAQVPAAALSE